MILKDTNEMFADDLRDPAYAAGYLNIALEDDGIGGFLYALQKVARAHGISKIAASSDLSRESLYRALSDKGNPGIKPLTRMLGSLGLCLTVSPSDPEVATDAPILQVDAPIPQEQPQTTLEIAALQRTVEQGFAMLRDTAEQLAVMQEEARRERMEARRAAMALQEEAHRSHAQLQQLAAVMEDRARRDSERGERTTLSGMEPAATYSFPTRTGKQRIDEKMYQPNPLRLVKGAA